MLYYGMETSQLNMNQFIIRGKPHQNITLKVDYSYSDKKNFSAFFSSRDYHIINHDVANSIQVQHGNNIFWGVLYTFQNKNNLSGVERMQAHDAAAEFSYRITNKGNIMAKLQYKYIDFKPVNAYNPTQSAVSYEMLEGLQNGNNILWNVGFQTNITEFLQLDLRYEGRSSEGAKVVHTGLMQLKAFF
jgi:opacity protein-like surface antigen